jgi:hypothetical protein
VTIWRFGSILLKIFCVDEGVRDVRSFIRLKCVESGKKREREQVPMTCV